MAQFLWIALPTLILAGLLWFVIPYLLRRCGQRKLSLACMRQNAICLTFDDGPGAHLTGDLLELLKSYDARATFFMLGRQADAHPEVVDAVNAAGHEVASHSYDHHDAWRTLPWVVAKDISKGRDAVERQVGRRVRFRPPFGKTTIASLIHIKLAGLRVGWWTLDSGDTWPSLPTTESVLERLSASGGGAVLLHDFDRQRPEERVQFVLDTTRAILELAAERSIPVISMADLEERVGA